MQRIAQLFLSMAILAISALPASAQEQDPDNSYTYWMQLQPYLESTESEVEGEFNPPLISQDDFDLLMGYLEEPLRPMNAEERRILQEAQPAIELINQASQAEYYDANLDYDQGFEMLMPHLSLLRNGSQLLAIQARSSAADGDIESANQWLAALGAIATQASDDATTISSLVSGVMYRTQDTELDQFIGSGFIDQQSAQLFLDSMQNLALEDPFNFGGAIFTERDMMLKFFDDLIDNDEEERAELFAEFASFGNQEPPSGYSDEDLIAEREIASGLLDQLVEGFNDPDRERGRALVEDVSAQVELLAAEGNLIIGMMMPSIDRILTVRDEFEDKVNQRLRQLEGVASGRIKPEALKNAAVIWLPTGRMASRLDPIQQSAAAVLLGLPPETCLPLPRTGVPSDLQDAPEVPTFEEALAIWKEAMDLHARDVLVAGLDAASISNADFSVNSSKRPFIQPEYLGELRAAGRVLLASAAVRRLNWEASETIATNSQQREVADINALLAAEEISAVLVLIRHLHDDPAIAHAILGAALLEEAAIQIEAFAASIVRREAAGIDNPQIDRAILQRLRNAMEKVPRNDAFGLRAGLEADREHFLEDLSRSSSISREANSMAILARFLVNRDADHLAVMLAADSLRGPIDSIDREDRLNLEKDQKQQMQKSIEKSASMAPWPPLVRMDDVIPLAPSMRGDGILRKMLLNDLREALALEVDVSAVNSAIGRLNLTPVIDVRGGVRRGYGRISDVDQALRSIPDTPTTAAP